ncbi:MAG: radical SAM protein [Deltaproteobacteria bacterium]|nr:radical SAM protein [Deltaproteobacteria bacterium]
MGAYDIPLMSAAVFGEELDSKAYTRRIPISGSFEITFRCNLRCTHCYCNLPADDRQAREEELKTAEIFSILDQIAEAGCLWLLLTGGEPLVRDDFREIYTFAKRKGFLITLFTNGTLITPKTADFLAAWPPHDLEIPLYASSQETYYRITGSPDGFRHCLRGIELLRERKIPFSLKTVVTTQNKDELLQIKSIAKRLGLAFRFDAALTPRIDGGKAPCRLRLSPHEVVALDKADTQREQEWREEFKKPPEHIMSDRLFLCGAGMTSFHIDPYGKMGICDMYRFHTYDLRSGTFREGWNGVIPLLLESARRETESPCPTCLWTAQCDNCAGWSWMENGSLEAPVEYHCLVTRLRAEAFGQNKEII